MLLLYADRLFKSQAYLYRLYEAQQEAGNKDARVQVSFGRLEKMKGDHKTVQVIQSEDHLKSFGVERLKDAKLLLLQTSIVTDERTAQLVDLANVYGVESEEVWA